jgi:hypothetical protein
VHTHQVDVRVLFSATKEREKMKMKMAQNEHVRLEGREWELATKQHH